MTCFKWILSIAAWFFILVVQNAGAQDLQIEAVNELPFGRLNQTISIEKKALEDLTKGKLNLRKVKVEDDAGRTLLSQAVDRDGDLNPDIVVFQADFGPHQKRMFHLSYGEIPLLTPLDYKAFGRFVRERLDDFAWENDRIAQRTYGPALKKAKRGALTSSAIDIWPKSTSRLVINDWYLTDHYHVNTGEGADLYRSGKSMGVGGEGVWENEELWMSENFTQSNTLANGPIRIAFELAFDAFEAGTKEADKSKKITLDAGQNLNHYLVDYGKDSKVAQVAMGIQITDISMEEIRKGLPLPVNNGLFIERFPGKTISEDHNAEEGWLTMEQPVSEGLLYTAIIFEPKNFEQFTKNEHNNLVIQNLSEDKKLSYWAGYSWSESGQFENYEAWKAYIRQFAEEIRNPIKIKIEK